MSERVGDLGRAGGGTVSPDGLTRLVELAHRALRQACDLEETDERLRLAEVAREVVRAASAQLDLDDALASCTEPLTGRLRRGRRTGP